MWKRCLLRSMTHKPWWHTLARPLFFSCLLSDRHMDFLPGLFPHPYLNLSIPPHLPNATSPRILSHPLGWLSVIQRCAFFKCLRSADFEPPMPQAPRRDLRKACGLASNLSYLACSHEETHSLHPAHQRSSQVLTPSTGHWSPVLLRLHSDWVYAWTADQITTFQASCLIQRHWAKIPAFISVEDSFESLEWCFKCLSQICSLVSIVLNVDSWFAFLLWFIYIFSLVWNKQTNNPQPPSLDIFGDLWKIISVRLHMCFELSKFSSAITEKIKLFSGMQNILFLIKMADLEDWTMWCEQNLCYFLCESYEGLVNDSLWILYVCIKQFSK